MDDIILFIQFVSLPVSSPEGELLCLPLSIMLDRCPSSSPPSAPSAPPQKVRLLSLSSTSIEVSWVAPPTDSRHGEIVGYSLAYRALTGENLERRQVSGIAADVTSFTLEDLEKWTEYLVWVRARTDVGPGPESPAARIRTQEDGMLMGSRKHYPAFNLLLAGCCSTDSQYINNN